MNICIALMSVTFLLIFYAMIGYPVLLLIIDRLRKPTAMKKVYDYEPIVSYMIVAHNEEKVIEEKLNNALQLDYSKEKLQIVVASDFSTDRTNQLVKQFAVQHQEYEIILCETQNHYGKTNAQNEARKLCKGEIIIMTDANAMLQNNAIKELVASFSENDIAYVCGQLVYTNLDNITGQSESTYWNIDLRMRDIESRMQTITAGNGSIYAVRNEDYIDIPVISCHDATMPYLYALQGKKAKYNPQAISYEKSGQTNADEFGRKVRMNRGILNVFANSVKALNIFKYKWFSVFYFGHRTCRYLLWFNHIIFFGASFGLAILSNSIASWMLVLLQIVAICLGCYSIKHVFRIKSIKMVGYYAMTVIAQAVGAYRQFVGKSKSTWEKNR